VDEKSPASTGYRPNHLVTRGFLTSGVHEYPDADWVQPGETAEVLITFAFPQHYPKSLWRGKTIRIQEGGRIFGFAEIIEVYNPTLDRDA
jgi:hypothetical protein